MKQDLTEYLDTFPGWLKRLAQDVEGLFAVVDDESIDRGVRLRVASGLNYLIRSLDLIPDGLEELGFVDDAFVLRVVAGEASELSEAEQPLLHELAEQAGSIRAFLQQDFGRLKAYVATLASMSARGRTPEAIVDDAETRKEFHREIEAWVRDYTAPTFARDPKSLTTLRAFLKKKLESY